MLGSDWRIPASRHPPHKPAAMPSHHDISRFSERTTNSNAHEATAIEVPGNTSTKHRATLNISVTPMKRRREDTAAEEGIDGDPRLARYGSQEPKPYTTASFPNQRDVGNTVPIGFPRLGTAPRRPKYSNVTLTSSPRSSATPTSQPSSVIGVTPRCRQCKKRHMTRYDPIVQCRKCSQHFHETCGIFAKGPNGQVCRLLFTRKYIY